MSKQDAINLVVQFRSESGTGRWPQINRSDLAQGLMDRINDPNKIDQAGTPLCGPASFVRSVAMDQPVAYAQAAIDLYKTGTARLGRFTIAPGSELKGDAPEGGTHHADWILLASIRDTDNLVFSTSGWFSSNMAGITRPGTMESWLEDTGYTDIKNDTYLDNKAWIFMVLKAVRANELFQKGYKVLLFVDADMLNAEDQDDITSAFPNHWITLTSPISGLGSDKSPVTFKTYTWGGDLSVPVNPRRSFFRRHFGVKFYGYIAARR